MGFRKNPGTTRSGGCAPPVRKRPETIPVIARGEDALVAGRDGGWAQESRTAVPHAVTISMPFDLPRTS
jgi:hypothetical protein